ncbi:phage tail tape measure protein [Pectobacterium cacticida]|uniref:Phage tail tape measure protein n=1 Tax=Pectobacterium cacticida TaxID=69221 RepID=A0ABZ2GCD8_9GAMM|nr:phage tail tape measure protein [Pectobacterium cacticida]UYX06117.1 phage tail tape measure protein [Pectobacterium cacticida]
MARNLQLALTLSARDTGSKVLRKAMQDAVAQTKAAEKAGDELAKSQQQNSQQGIRASRTLSEEFKRANSARSTLGIRSEREIQREIQQTIAAYSRLTRMGVMSASEQSRAFSAMTDRVSRLRTELSGAAHSMSRMDKLRAGGAGAMAIAGGAAAMTAVVAQPVRNQMSYERRLASMANTAYAEQGVDGRKAGMASMDALIRRSVKEGGGTKESAADTLDALLASGAVDMKSADTLLPQLQRYSTATGAAPTDLAQIAIRLKQTFGIEDKDVSKALNMAISAGQAGSFELADMAKWLPQQLAAASNNGMKGLNDFAVLLGLNQSAAITAGNSDEAGNNVVNLLGKITSQDAANAASRIKVNGKGIDLPGSLANAQGKGMNSLDAFVAIIDKVVATNPAYKKLDAKLATAKGDERRQIMQSQAKILEGSAVGQVIADRQALMALIGYRSNRQYARDVVKGANEQRDLEAGKTAGDINYQLIAETNDFKAEQMKNTADFGQVDSIKPLSDVIGRLSDLLTGYANEYPGLTTAIAGATIGIKALGAGAVTAGGVLAAWKLLSGNGINPPSVTPVPPGTNAPTVTPPGTRMPNLLGRVGRVAGKVLTPLAVYQATQDAPLVQVERGDSQARQRLSTNQYANETERLQDSMRAQPGALDAWDEIKAWWNKPRSIEMPKPMSYGLPGYVTDIAANQNIGIRPPPVPVVSADNVGGVRPVPVVRIDPLTVSTDKKDDSSAWWSKPTSIGSGLPPAALGLPDWMRPTPAPVQPKQHERPIQATIRLEVDGRVLAETVNEINSQQATRGSNGVYQ